MSVRILVGDCRERMAALEAGSVDSCVTDPPYHLTANKKGGSGVKSINLNSPYGRSRIGTGNGAGGFMGQKWDGGDVAFDPETWAAVYRVLKPGSHLVAFSGTRTYHRMACAIEDAGFEIRDQLAWTYGSGFPKSHNQPGGWGTALKPAWEPICLARKPLQGTVAANMAAHGTGAINIDGCRVGYDPEDMAARTLRTGKKAGQTYGNTGNVQHSGGEVAPVNVLGRWPANIIHDGSGEVLAHFPDAPGQQGDLKNHISDRPTKTCLGNMGPAVDHIARGDSGSAARFFYCAKATSAERGEGNNHPTVKPVDLMRWLCRLVTPKGGLVLDPFAGSGSTLIAADAEQFHAIGCELSPDYAAIAEKRVRDAAGMFADVLAA